MKRPRFTAHGGVLVQAGSVIMALCLALVVVKPVMADEGQPLIVKTVPDDKSGEYFRMLEKLESEERCLLREAEIEMSEEYDRVLLNVDPLLDDLFGLGSKLTMAWLLVADQDELRSYLQNKLRLYLQVAVTREQISKSLELELVSSHNLAMLELELPIDPPRLQLLPVAEGFSKITLPGLELEAVEALRDSLGSEGLALLLDFWAVPPVVDSIFGSTAMAVTAVTAGTGGTSAIISIAASIALGVGIDVLFEAWGRASLRTSLVNYINSMKREEVSEFRSRCSERLKQWHEIRRKAMRWLLSSED